MQSLEWNYPEVYKQVEELAWAQDSITSIERDAIEWLYWLAGERRRATVSLIALPWIQDSITETERDALEWLFWLANEDWEAYEEAIDKPFLETLEANDVLTIRRMTGRESESYMGRLRSLYPTIAKSIEDLPWTQSPNTETELDAIEWLYWLAGEAQDTAATVAVLPWVQDGITHTERSAIKRLYWLAYEDEELAATVIAFPWPQDSIMETEQEAIKQLFWLSRQEDGGRNTANLETVLRFPWVQDNITATEAEFLDFLEDLDHGHEELAAKIIAFPWPQDSIMEAELKAIKQLYWLSRQEDGGRNAANLQDVLRFPWVQDNITATEAEFLDFLEALDNSHEELAAKVIAFPWPQDAISEMESNAVRYLHYLNYDNPRAAAQVVAMPFLKSLEPDDLLMMRGMDRLDNQGRLSALLDHPTLRNGITDAQTTLVTAASTLRDDEEVRRMLNPGYADIETLSSGTKLTPNLKISIVRTGSQPQPWTAEGVRYAAEFAERTMQLPLPISHVIIVLNDKAFTENYGGTNFGFAFGYDPEDEQPQDTYDGLAFQSGLVHETGHYFWRGHADWIDEGVADTLQYMYGVETGVSSGLLEKPRRKTSSRECKVYDLEALTEADPEKQDLDQFYCNYFLGQSLFLELLESMGAERFNERLRDLYRLSLAAMEADETPGIAEVRQAFPDLSEIVEKHWSGKLNAPENRSFDEGTYRRNHDLIQWAQYPTYDGNSVIFRGTLLDDAVLSSETIEQARKGGYQNFTLFTADEGDFKGSILPPLNNDSNWTLDDPGDTIAAEYRLEGKTFTIKFRFPQKLGDPSDYVVGVWGFQDESRTPFVQDNIDMLGYARIRVE